MSDNHRLQFITHHNDRYSYADSARLALEGGCRWIQLRMKGADEALMFKTATIVQAMCKRCGATFIIDDDVMLARRIGADGVHLGKEDMPIAKAREILGRGYMPVAEARAILGAETIIGATVNSFEDIAGVVSGADPDYFGCGPLRFTTTKQRLAPILGIEGYRDIMCRMRAAGIAIPLVAIGGVTKEDIPSLLRCGVAGIALSGSILQADDPIAEMQGVSDAIHEHSK